MSFTSITQPAVEGRVFRGSNMESYLLYPTPLSQPLAEKEKAGI
uniref:Uncharacterized protein n=1 Tax=Anguilla anguilla TaxID=7936 RepID=A0A0E9U265_ANGAN